MSAASFAQTPEPPYYAVIFTNQRSLADDDGYVLTAERMVQLARQQPGFLGAESTRGADGFGITVSYWQSLQDIARWKTHAEHQLAQQTGQTTWYTSYTTRIARVERAYSHP